MADEKSPLKKQQQERPVDLFEDLQRSMNQLMDEFLGPSRWSGYHWPARPVDRRFPPVNIAQRGQQIVLQAELPGFEENDLSISLKDNVLIIRGEYPHEELEPQGIVLVQEFAHGAFRREIRLPKEVASDQVQAELRNGLLTVTLPLKEEEPPRSRTIPIG